MRTSSELPVAHPDTPRSRTGFVCAAILAVLTALVMVRLASSLEPYAAASSEVSGTRAAAQNFYDAVNQVLLTGSGGPLSEHVAVDARFSDGIDDGWLNIDELVGRLSETGEGNPRARLEVTSLTIDGTEAVAIVRLTGAGDRLTAATTFDSSDSWIDKLTVRDGVVSALSGGTAGLRTSTVMFDGPVHHTRSAAAVGLVTLTVEPGAVIPVVAPGALVAQVIEGTLLLEFDDESYPAALHTPGFAVAESKPGRQSMAVRSGDLFTVLKGNGFTLRNETTQPASLRLIALLNPIPLEPGTARKHQSGRFSGFMVNAASGSTWEGTSGGRALMDSRQEFATEPGSKRLRVEQIALGDDASLIPLLSASYNNQVVVLTAQGIVVTASAGGPETKPVLMEGPAGTVLPYSATRMQQIGELSATLVVVRLDPRGGGA